MTLFQFPRLRKLSVVCVWWPSASASRASPMEAPRPWRTGALTVWPTADSCPEVTYGDQSVGGRIVCPSTSKVSCLCAMLRYPFPARCTILAKCATSQSEECSTSFQSIKLYVNDTPVVYVYQVPSVQFPVCSKSTKDISRSKWTAIRLYLDTEMAYKKNSR